MYGLLLDDIVRRIAREELTSWLSVEDDFLRAVSAFDERRAAPDSTMTEGEYQKKAYYFNEIEMLFCTA